ncbi:MAG TPA: hypothetical protein DCQ33_14535 [Nitrospira sp.]|nr:hypothetical protein [Nitrospira sp.]
MFLKPPKASTDPSIRSLLQKAARRGFPTIVELAVQRLDQLSDRSWLRSRAVVITFEECWPLADSLILTRQLSSRRDAVLLVARATKQKDAAGLGALAYAYREGDRSMLGHVPDGRGLEIVAEAITQPDPFFEWAHLNSKSQRSRKIVSAAKQYLAAATWGWDKASILAGAFLASMGEPPEIALAETRSEQFPYWVALDKHTPQGKPVLREVAAQVKSSYRQLIWASFYCESAAVNSLLPSPWWEAEKAWRLHRAGLTCQSADELWARARDLIRVRLTSQAFSLEESIAGQATNKQRVMLS